MGRQRSAIHLGAYAFDWKSEQSHYPHNETGGGDNQRSQPLLGRIVRNMREQLEEQFSPAKKSRLEKMRSDLRDVDVAVQIKCYKVLPLRPHPLPRESHLALGPKRSATTTSMSSISGYQGSLSEIRKKQSKRDEGTVAALKPTPALTVPENITVAEASQLCAAKRTDCVLVVDDEEGLSGIFTAKDLAYRVTADGLEPHTTQVHQIMTRNPMVTRDTTSATEALQLMVSKHFRHLGNVVGLLDITKVFHEALAKVERSSAASEQLFSAMAGVQSELGGGISANPQAAAMLAWAESLKEKTALPDLTTVMDSRTHPATVGPKATVREVAKLMKERRTTAVCVMEAPFSSVEPAKIAGIFTSKDVVLRVIAAGLDAGRCSVVRVMTPHPDTAPPR
ncbi:CBS-domain-containing protein [Salix suchowensis]|nr:CBS-domain-containing protein [Salix suchowensis]